MFLKENYEPRGTENGQGKKSEHTFKPEAIVFITLQTFCKQRDFEIPHEFSSVLAWVYPVA